MNSNQASSVQFQDLLAAMAEVDRLKSRDEILAAEADLPARIAEVTQRLTKMYADQRVKISPEIISAGVEQYFSQRLKFQEPKSSFSAGLAYVWTLRNWIFLYSGAFVFGVGLIAASAYYFFYLPQQQSLSERLNLTRAQVAKVFEKIGDFEKGEIKSDVSRINTLLEEANRQIKYPETKQAEAIAKTKIAEGGSEAIKMIEQASHNLQRYIPANSKIVAENLEEARGVLYVSVDLINKSHGIINAIGDTSNVLLNLERKRNDIEKVWRSLDSALPSIRIESAAIYEKALLTISNMGSMEIVDQCFTKLQNLEEQQRTLALLPQMIRDYANAARAVSKDPIANEKIDNIEKQGLAEVETGNATNSKKRVDDLRLIINKLRLSYQLRIVNRPGEYTRLWRYPNANRAAKNYYIVVEAIDSEGMIVQVPIVSEEDGSIAKVSKWAERVDEATYEAVGRDKKDDGIVQNNDFARKEQGYLNLDYRMGAKAHGGNQENGRIHRWEYRG